MSVVPPKRLYVDGSEAVALMECMQCRELLL